MTAAQIAKLTIVLSSSALATTLAGGGYPLPANIKDASDGDLGELLDGSELAAVRAILPENQ